MTQDERLPPNYYKPPIRVWHSQLVRTNDETLFRSECPACFNGVLLVGRQQRTFELMREDRCIACCQHFTYLDETIGNEKPISLEGAPTVNPSPLLVWHSQLARTTLPESCGSRCIACPGGQLLTVRDPDTKKRVRQDFCSSCGQSYVYQDEAIAGESLPPLE